ncbi:hypothetical protein [Streptomyces sp. enrichment culture]|uniref:hypothetical protein n=1 Tax=Streptomyces sp. enrichment culture TaxID=1795815 RepID=UPI003F5723C5
MKTRTLGGTMACHRRTWAALTAAAAATALALTGCADEESTPQNPVGSAASAAESAASRAGEVVESATAEVQQRFDDITGGVDVKKDVTLGKPTTDRDGRAAAEVTVRNTAGSTKSFAVQVTYNDQGGNFLDTVVVTVADVPAGETRSGTARSNRDLSGNVKTEVSRALRY